MYRVEKFLTHFGKIEDVIDLSSGISINTFSTINAMREIDMDLDPLIIAWLDDKSDIWVESYNNNKVKHAKTYNSDHACILYKDDAIYTNVIPQFWNIINNIPNKNAVISTVLCSDRVNFTECRVRYNFLGIILKDNILIPIDNLLDIPAHGGEFFPLYKEYA